MPDIGNALSAAGFPHRIANEIIAIKGGSTTNPVRLAAMGVSYPLAIEMSAQLTSKVVNQNALMSLGMSGPQATAFAAIVAGAAAAATPITVPADAAALYSARQVSGYSGPSVRVVRGSDMAEQDIGWGSDGFIDTATALALRANADDMIYVKRWYDQSGNARDAFQNTLTNMPIINPLHGAVICVGTRQGNVSGVIERFMEFPASVALDRASSTIVHVIAASVSSKSNVAWQFGATADNLAWYNSTSSNQLLSRIANGATVDRSPAALGQKEFGALAPAGVYKGRAARFTITAAASLTLNEGGRLGRRGVTTVPEQSGRSDFSFWAAYPSTLTDAQILALRATLETSLAIPVAADNKVVFTGDSITESIYTDHNDTISLLAMRGVTAPNSTFTNIGIGGITSGTINTNKATREGAMYDGTVSGKFLYHLWVGINDISAGSTGANIWTNSLLPLIQYLIALGAKSRLVVGTILPHTGGAVSSSRDNERLALNTLIRNNAATYSYTDAVMGPNAANADTSLYADGVHPTRKAYIERLAPISTAAINTAMAA
jgi:hypothetical protein